MINVRTTYCPVCFSEDLELSQTGKITLFFNGKQHETASLRFDLLSDSPEDLEQKLIKALVNYFKFYSEFKNKEPISEIDATSVDFKCSNSCFLPPGTKVSVVNLLFKEEFLHSICEDLADEYSLDLDF